MKQYIFTLYTTDYSIFHAYKRNKRSHYE